MCNPRANGMSSEMGIPPSVTVLMCTELASSQVSGTIVVALGVIVVVVVPVPVVTVPVPSDVVVVVCTG